MVWEQCGGVSTKAKTVAEHERELRALPPPVTATGDTLGAWDHETVSSHRLRGRRRRAVDSSPSDQDRVRVDGAVFSQADIFNCLKLYVRLRAVMISTASGRLNQNQLYQLRPVGYRCVVSPHAIHRGSHAVSLQLDQELNARR